MKKFVLLTALCAFCAALAGCDQDVSPADVYAPNGETQINGFSGTYPQSTPPAPSSSAPASSSSPETSSAAPSGDFTTASTGGGVRITKYNGSGGIVVIPSQLDGENVKDIDNDAFAGCAALTGVVVPAGVTNIGSRAFADCPELISAELPDRIMVISPDAFNNCTKVKVGHKGVSYTYAQINDLYKAING